MAGQTLSEIRALLAERGLTPRRRFGQNFLIDLNLMRKLVDAAEVAVDDVVLEVGPGTGSMTELLLEREAQVVAVEIDRGLAGLLCERFGDRSNFTLLNCDVLSGKHAISDGVLAALRAHRRSAPGAMKLVANLPYQIATPLLMELLVRGDPAFDLMAFTIQKEVGQRLTARPQTHDYGPISVITDVAAEVDTLANVPASAFWPQPKVESSMILVRPKVDPEIDDLAAFSSTVHRAFLHRRQMLRRIVSRWEDASAVSALAALGIDSSARPQDLCPDDWLRFHRSLGGPAAR